MAQRLIESYPLRNGLTLVCLDQSRKIAGDRWYVCVSVEISIPVEERWFDEQAPPQVTFQQISDELGKTVVFKSKKERHFVADDEKDGVVAAICESAEKMGRDYYGKDIFAARYLLRAYKDK